ncbi:hypothetical protein ACEN9X_15550 [Mucilaginibacter sp. Mucisp86]|uniref:hypothetical protein n=1 Tax=Mucilaginibacter sp. Mucisp86 TaxID=3243060 RepID=UPI0039B68847
MSRPAFIVDGFTELKIVQRLCPGSPVQRTDLNGRSVTVNAICSKISSLIRILNNRYYPIVILIDKEDRDISFKDFASQVTAGLKKDFQNDDIRVGVADRMIENWIISDWKTFCLNKSKKPSETDGINGTSMIKKVKGIYNKRADGVDLFIKNNPSIMYKTSASFKYFIDLLDDVDCHFTQFKNNN